MPWNINNEHRWAVILAGGEGVRLRTLSRFVSGDDRPKQFCPFLGGRSLLAQTRSRINRRMSANRSLFVLLASHELFYRQELENVNPIRVVEQPSNRGTLPAVLYALLRVTRLDPHAVVAFFPSDHHYSDEDNFMAGVELAFGCAEKNPTSVVLVATPANYPATDYGWIEAAAAVSSPCDSGFLKVKRFWEKPCLSVAKDLLDRGCVWNTFVMVGTAEAFVDAIRSNAADVFNVFDLLSNVDSPEEESRIARRIYEEIPTSDLSKCVLSELPERLGVFCLGDVGWSDLGNPERLLEVLARTGERSDWLSEWHGTMHSTPLAKGTAAAIKCRRVSVRKCLKSKEAI